MEPILVLTPEFIILVMSMSYIWTAAYFPSLIVVPLTLLLSVVEVVIELCVSIFTPAKKASTSSRRLR